MLSRAAVVVVAPSQPRESMDAARGLMLSRDSGGILSRKPARESMAHFSIRKSGLVGRAKRKLRYRFYNRQAHPYSGRLVLRPMEW
jgi:hypothetical protein